MMQHMYHILYRAVVFRESLRNDFLEGLRLQLEAGIALVDIMSLIQQTTTDHTLKRLADLSLSSLKIGQPFAAQYTINGFFPAREAKLLIAGEQQGALPEIIELLTASGRHDQSFFSVVIVENAQWIFGLLAMLAITMYGVRYENLLTMGTTEPAQFFVYGHWLNQYLWLLAIIVLLLLLVYFQVRGRVHGVWRHRLRQVGCFSVHDMAIGAELCDLLAALFRRGVAQSVALDIILSSASGNRRPGYLETTLRHTEETMKHGPTLVPALGQHVLDDTSTARLLLQAPRQTVPELAKAMSQQAIWSRRQVARMLATARTITAGITAAVAFVFLLPLINVLMGTTMQTGF